MRLLYSVFVSLLVTGYPTGVPVTIPTASDGSAQRGGVFWQGGGTATVRNAAWDANHALEAGAAVYQQAGTLEASFGTSSRPSSFTTRSCAPSFPSS